MSQSTKRLEQEILSRKQDIAEIIKDLQLQVPNNGGEMSCRNVAHILNMCRDIIRLCLEIQSLNLAMKVVKDAR